MSFIQEAFILKNHLVSWVVSLVVVTVLIVSFGVTYVNLFGRDVLILTPSKESGAVYLFEKIAKDIVPPNVGLIATNPVAVIVSETKIALLCALVLTFPLFLYRIYRYISPALYRKEKNVIILLILPSSLLFVGGALFAYYFLLPPLFKVLYSFPEVLGAESLLGVSDLVSWVTSLMFIVGVLFLLPVAMYILSISRVVMPSFWIAHWRGAIMTFLIVFAVLVPDVSGITMVLLALPMVVLYSVGIGVSLLTLTRKQKIVQEG